MSQDHSVFLRFFFYISIFVPFPSKVNGFIFNCILGCITFTLFATKLKNKNSDHNFLQEQL